MFNPKQMFWAENAPQKACAAHCSGHCQTNQALAHEVLLCIKSKPGHLPGHAKAGYLQSVEAECRMSNVVVVTVRCAGKVHVLVGAASSDQVQHSRSAPCDSCRSDLWSLAPLLSR